MNKDASISEKLWPFIFAYLLMLISLSEAGNVFEENVQRFILTSQIIVGVKSST